MKLTKSRLEAFSDGVIAIIINNYGSEYSSAAAN
ncbi:MAG: TMEM175 family protein [Oscillospiraceae bacterium]|nr:TMEM175 family protein [Oscillospiraceae bacterium]